MGRVMPQISRNEPISENGEFGAGATADILKLCPDLATLRAAPGCLDRDARTVIDAATQE